MQGLIDMVEDDFWTERLPFFTAQFPTYYREPKQVHGRIHTSDERYFDGSHEILPLTQRRGQRTYVMMHPYVGPAGAFAQEYTVMRNTLSDHKLYRHEKASQYHTSDLTVL